MDIVVGVVALVATGARIAGGVTTGPVGEVFVILVHSCSDTVGCFVIQFKEVGPGFKIEPICGSAFLCKVMYHIYYILWDG